MRASKLTFRESTLKQTGTVGKILMWIQDNPSYTRDTSFKQVANMVRAAMPDMAEGTVRCALNKMHLNQMILKSSNGKCRGRIYINYYHKDIPGYVLERAPQDIQDRVKAMKENLEKNQYIDDFGCVTTKGERKTADNGTDMRSEESGSRGTDESVKEISLPMLVKREKDGRNISLTININLDV